MRLKAHMDRDRVPENDDVLVAGGAVRNNASLFWTMRAAATLALYAKKRLPKDDLIQAKAEHLLKKLKELDVVV